MKYLLKFRESLKHKQDVKNIKIKHKKEIKDITEKYIEDIEDCLLDVSDKFTMRFVGLKKYYTNKVFIYEFENIDTSMLESFISELRRSINNLKRMDAECSFGVGRGDENSDYDFDIHDEWNKMIKDTDRHLNINKFYEKINEFVKSKDLGKLTGYSPNILVERPLEKINIDVFIW